MKTLRFLGTALIATLMCVACSNEEIVPEEQEAKYVTVDLGVTGEYLKVSEMPLATRATITSDTYAIKVYTLETNGTEKTYASGLFTSLSNVKIKLLEGQKYSFKIGIFIDDQISEWEEGLGEYYSNGFDRFNVDLGFQYLSGGPLYPESNELDYYYGELAEYTPTEGGTVNIETKRVVYGANFIAEGLTEGRLDITVEKPGCCSNRVLLTDEKTEYDGVYRFCNPQNAWKGILDAATGTYANYYDNMTLILKWTKDNGYVMDLGQYTVTFKRNVKTIVKININDKTDVSNGIVVTRREEAMTNDDNQYVIEVEDGTITEVPVTSQQ